MRILVQTIVLLTVVVLAQEQQDTTEKNNIDTAIISDATVDKVNAGLKPSKNPVLAEDSGISENSENNEITEDLETETEPSLDSQDSEDSEHDHHNHDQETKPEVIEDNKVIIEDVVENNEENSSLQGGEQTLDLNKDQLKEKVKEKVVDKLDEIEDNIENKLEIDEKRVEQDKKQLEAVGNAKDKLTGAEDSSDEVTESNESVEEPEVTEKVETTKPMEMGEPFDVQNLIHCKENGDCLEVQGDQNENGNTTTEIIILVVIIIVVILLIGGCIYFIKITHVPKGSTEFSDGLDKPASIEEGRFPQDSMQNSTIVPIPENPESSDPLLQKIEPVHAYNTNLSSSDEKEFEPEPFNKRSPNDDIKKSLKRLDNVGLGTLGEEMDAKVTLGREKKGSRPPPVYPSKNLTDEEMLRNSNVSLSTIPPGDPRFGSI